MSIYIQSRIESGLVLADSDLPLKHPRILNVSGAEVQAPMFREQKLENGSFRYWFDASALERWTPDTPVLYVLEANGEKVRFGYVSLRPDGNRLDRWLPGDEFPVQIPVPAR